MQRPRLHLYVPEREPSAQTLLLPVEYDTLLPWPNHLVGYGLFSAIEAGPRKVPFPIGGTVLVPR
jgi:hypothetical protein